jgi:hypothetical protein
MNRNVITVERAGRLIAWMTAESLHAKRVQSVTNGVVSAVSLPIHAIGAGLARTSELHVEGYSTVVPVMVVSVWSGPPGTGVSPPQTSRSHGISNPRRRSSARVT